MNKLLKINALSKWLMVCVGWGMAGVATVSAQIPEAGLKKMASTEFSVREQGYEEIKKWANKNLKTAPEQLYQSWKSQGDPELKTRCYTLMKEAVIQREFGRGKGFVGVRMEEVVIPGQAGAAGRMGVRISQVVPGTPAQKAGLSAGDIVLGVDDFDFAKIPKKQVAAGAVNAFSTYIQSKHPEDVITLHILRGGNKIDKKVRLMLRPDDADVNPFGNDFGRRTAKKVSRPDAFFSDWLRKKEGK